MYLEGVNQGLAATEENLVKVTVRGFTRSIILWLVSRKPCSGYEIIKEIKRLTGQDLKTGNVYPLLYELEEKGFIRGRWAEKGRRRIKYYSATKRGRKILDKMKKLFELPIRDALIDLLGEEQPVVYRKRVYNKDLIK